MGFSLRVHDEGRFEESSDDGGGSVANAIVTAPLGDGFAIENMPAFGIDWLAAVTSRRICGREDVKVKLLFEGDKEEVAWLSVGLDAARQ